MMRSGSIFCVVLFLISCQPVEVPTKRYLFLGHPYSWLNPYKVDPRLEKLDYGVFDQVWLGGDVCAQTTEKISTLHYLDSLFDLDSEHLHWTIGNHDLRDGSEDQISQFTKRPSFYTTWIDGICLMVLNTNLFWFYDAPPPPVNCEEKAAQLEMVESVLDSIESATHLVVLHHHALLNDLKTDSTGAIIKTFNINPLSIRPTCDSTLELSPWLYPKLEKVQQKNVQVILIGGDFGMRAKEFAYQTPAGIWLLGSGINNSVPRSQVPDYVTSLDPDKVLILEHQPESGKLEWSFVLLDSLLRSSSFH